ncbi:MAG TPA: glycoside hydrolase family 38 C-terminal domain-containing protein [Gemmatimonadales bacterium]|nr:glycoside hydrolase family 38 C-terminal domain-containing protein [Gemmatimonadales bacterium]
MNRLTFHLIPHTHWDREWYLTRAAFQARLVPVLDEVLEQLEADPQARFVLDGQTILLEDYLAIRPEHTARIEALVQRGALEIGPWYVLSDLLIPSLASLRRNLEEGTRDAARFGKRLDVLYSPDAFGHPAGLPALAAEFGIHRAVIRRGLGRPSGRDRDLYRWEAADGSGLLVYHLPAAGYDMASGLAALGVELPRRWGAIRDQLVERATGSEIAVFLGADHHPMAREVNGLCARLQELEPRHSVRVSGLTEFFEAVERSGIEPSIIRGELRRGDGHSWVLQGVHATRSRLKRNHAVSELRLSRLAEPLERLAREQDGLDRRGLVRTAWRALLQSQFHDTLAGTTSDAVQREQEVRLDTVDALCQEVAKQSLVDLLGPDPRSGTSRLLLWNPVKRVRSGIVTAELSFFRKDILVGPPTERKPRLGKGQQPFALAGSSGDLFPVQVLSVRRDQERLDVPRSYPDQDEVDRVWVAFSAPQVPGWSSSALTPRGARRAPSGTGLVVREGLVENQFVSASVSRSGALTLHDKQTGERYAALGVLEDEPDRGDLYTFSRGSGPALRGARPLSQSVIAAGPLVGALDTRWELDLGKRGEVGARLVVALYADSPVVRLRLDLDNRASDHRLRAWFPVGAGNAALAGTGFGIERRSPSSLADNPAALEQLAATAPAQRFVAAAAGSRGLALFAPGCFEYEWTAELALAITLLRSVGELSRGDLPERPGHAAWPMSTPLAQERGAHRVELALAAGGEAELAQPAWLERSWEDVFLPLQAVYFRASSDAH